MKNLLLIFLFLFTGLSADAQFIPPITNVACTPPAAIGGTLSACTGATSQLTDATAGGTWSSTNTAVATIGTAGLVTGVSSGTATISYQFGNCAATATFTVIAQPAAITGTLSACSGATSQLSNAVAGGVWSSVTTTVATVGTAGLVTGVAAGTSTISYAIGSCFAINTFTVNTQPAAISGTLSACAAATSQLSDATAGGVWSSVTTTVATVGTAGLVTAVAAGTSTISYTIGSCFAVNTFTVNAQPAAISGTLTVNVSATTQLSDATAGGTWSSATTSVATIGTAGLVTGVSAGTSTISYVLTGGCYSIATVTVAAAAPIALVASGFAGTTGTTATTTSIDATGANFIVVAVTRQNGQTSSVTDSRGNTYTQDDAQSSVAGIDLWRSYTTNVSSSMTISASSGGVAVALYYLIFSNTVGSTVDGNNSYSASAATGNAGAFPLTASGNGAVYIATVNDFNAAAPTIDNSFIIPSGCSNTLINTGAVLAYAGAIAYYIQPTASSLNPLWDFGSSIAYSTIFACYR